MRAAHLRKQPDGWDIPTLEDDAETQIYFNPSPEPELPALPALPPVRMSMPVAVAPVVPVLRAAPPPVPMRLPQPMPMLQPMPALPVSPALSRPMPRAVVPEDMVHTHRVARQPLHPRRFALVAIASACVLAGTMIGGAIAISGGSHAQRASASTTPAQVVVAPAPVVVAPAPAPAPAKVTITPIEQPAPQPAPIPADTRNTIIVAEEPAPAPQPVQAVQPAPRHHPHQTHHVAVPVVVAHAEPAPAPVAHAPAQPTGATGTLELSTKPPCEIVIDGKATGLMTPRRGIALSPGHHEVTLTNADQGIQLTTEVTVTAGQSVRMIRDFTK